MIRFYFLLFGLFSLLSTPAFSQRPLVTLDWTVAETLIALNTAPLAVGDAKSYQNWVIEPKLPKTIIDLGIRLQPNPEQIWLLTQQYKQKLHFINTSFYASVTEQLIPFAQVDIVDFYHSGDTWQNVVHTTKQIAEMIDKPQSAVDLLQQYQQKIDEIRPHLQSYAERPLLLVQFIDSRYLRVYAPNSLFGAVLNHLGLQNAWQGNYNDWGFQTIDVTQLSNLPANTRLVVIKPYPANIPQHLKFNSLWQHLDMAQDPLILPALWTFGGIPSAQRFAQALAHGLQQGGETW